MNSAIDVRRHGISDRAGVQAFVLLVTPPLMLVSTAWLFQEWSGTSIHSLLCLILAPFVIIAHAYAMWHLIHATMVLRDSRVRTIQAVSAAACSLVDVLACIAVAMWFV